ncbi:MAG: MgtC/SapB family protein [Patescibacteria group bacterium]|nr:MgtC/SapB family protein [Patescibacteria group bacterium]MBU2509573.1 MgtC/SapB family protein [Patescibacteria group bacterium]
MDLTTQEIIIRLVVAMVLSGLIGIEREVKHKPAGVRTNALIGLSAALMTISGLLITNYWPNVTDPTRIASVVVQGIGFLGAGAIIQASGSVRGLTTAATIWAVAGVGIAVGFGFYLAAFITALLILILLVVFGPIDAKLMGTEEEKNGYGLLRRKKR